MQPLSFVTLAVALIADTQPSNISAWQSAIPLFAAVVTALFGFGGVIVGLRWNARQAEKTEQRLRDNRRQVLRISLWAELKSLARVIKEEIAYIENNNFTWVPLVESFKIYIENIENLGLLTPAEAETITVAYYRYQENAGYIARIAKDQPEKPAIGRHIEFDFSKPTYPNMKIDVLNTLSGIVLSIEEAMRAIEKELRRTDWFGVDKQELPQAGGPDAHAPLDPV
ncbi:hypothetical protein HZZ13_00635 [Bradyrhizobium sp. CNPSo 4010]|uniref:Uncharacterized protein n=1 Tax=Bradyrhizobium agreste TaxID=2751811 RepID=A0ABS0PGK8_9BRAD|nr:hypothetical protein [Bradyrhizobium agreste]MBH5396327.1 hypothetical protein [Bradyrhizobium agreste]